VEYNVVGKSKMCLEIGSGDGTFSRYLNPYVYRIECCEMGEDLAKECRINGFKTHEVDFLDMKEKKIFNFATAIDVLEHVVDIQAFRNKCHKIVKKHKFFLLSCDYEEVE